LKEIKDNSGTQFDPKVANIFVSMIYESKDEEYK
jgi:HD-GYP domain-containing protein (c-di-GMP phosphodiesterase class II)